MPHRSDILTTLLGVALLAGACVDTDEPSPASERWDAGTTTGIHRQIEYSSKPVDTEGPTSIRSLLDINRSGLVWYGFGKGDAYPLGRRRKFGEPCDPDFGNKAYEIDELPATIEGIVTLVPRHYQKPSLCGQDHRFYGTYYIQDSSGSILVLKDSRIADFDYGDRVRLKVRGIMKSFGTMKVSAFEEAKVVRDRGPAPYADLDESFANHFGTPCGMIDAIPEGLGDSYRVSGKVCQPPTTRNFGAVVIYPEGTSCKKDPANTKTWRASLGVELEPRVLDLEQGEKVSVTGPVTCSFGNYSMVVSSVGQFEQYRTDPGSK